MICLSLKLHHSPFSEKRVALKRLLWVLPGTVNREAVLLLGSLGSLQPIALHPSTVLGTILPSLLFLVVVVRVPSRVQFFMTPSTAAHQASLSLTISRSLPKFVPIESVMLSNNLILCHPLLLLPSIFPSIREQSIRASASVLPVNIQGWFHLGLTGLISLQSEELSRVSSSTKIQKH